MIRGMSDLDILLREINADLNALTVRVQQAQNRLQSIYGPEIDLNDPAFDAVEDALTPEQDVPLELRDEPDIDDDVEAALDYERDIANQMIENFDTPADRSDDNLEWGNGYSVAAEAQSIGCAYIVLGAESLETKPQLRLIETDEGVITELDSWDEASPENYQTAMNMMATHVRQDMEREKGG